jgi:ABC-type branched-subunit amino acid transport system substrate-binding protein
MASWGKQTVLGAEIARDELSQGGNRLVLITEDHQLVPRKAVSAFQKLADIDAVDAVYSEFTPTSIAVAPLSKTKKTPVIYSAAAVSALSASPYIFKTYLDYVQGCRLVGEYWKVTGIKKVGILKANLEFGELCAQGMKQVYPEATEVEYTPGDGVATQILTLRSRGVEAVVNATFEPDFLRMLKNLNDLGWRPQIATQSDAITNETQTKFPNIFEKLVTFALPILPESFISRIKAKDPGNNLISLSAAGLAYLHVKQLYAARLACRNRDSECLVKHLAAARSDSSVGFRGWIDRTADFNVRLHTWEKGKEVEQLNPADVQTRG